MRRHPGSLRGSGVLPRRTQFRWPNAEHFFVSLARALFCAALVYAPWAFGSTSAVYIELLAKGLLTASGCWLLGQAFRQRRWVGVPILIIAVMLALLSLGWFMTLNARAVFDPDFHRFAAVEALRPEWPGTVDRQASQNEMLLITGLLGGLMISAELLRDRVWRARLVATVGVAAVSIICYGLIQRGLNIRRILWISELPGNTWPFATYLYHGNAGAFINLVWPWAAVLAVTEFEHRSRHLQRAGWMGVLVVCLAGMMVNASKAALIVGLGQGMILGTWALGRWWARVRTPDWRSALTLVLALVGSIGIVAWSVGWEQTVARWLRVCTQLTPENLRLLAYQCGYNMIPDAGWFGFGPATFAQTFPYYTLEAGMKIKGFWRYLHQDYLQTVIEWGKLGSGLWFGLFGGSWFAGWWVWQFRRRFLSPTERALILGSIVALLGTAFHCLVDFPLQIASLRLYAVMHLGLLLGLFQRGRIRSRKSAAAERREAKAVTSDSTGVPLAAPAQQVGGGMV